MDKLDREAKVKKESGGWERKVWGDISGKEVVDVARLGELTGRMWRKQYLLLMI